MIHRCSRCSSSLDGIIKVWDTGSSAELLTIRADKRFVTNVLFSPDGERIVSVGGDKTIKVWDSGNAERVMALNGNSDYIDALTYSPDGKYIISGDYEGIIKI